MNERVKKENRKALPKFLLIIVVSGLVGGVVGFGAGIAGGVGLADMVTGWLDAFWRVVTPWGIPVGSLVLLGGAFLQYRSAKRAHAAWDGEDELAMEGAERA